MSELGQIISAVDSTHETLVMATVVDVAGSSYRRPTARMLILPDGRHVGSISGGCIERDLCRVAADITRDGPRLISFDTREDSINYNPRYNLGCSGIICVLVERVTRNANCPTAILRTVLESSRAMVIATVYQAGRPDRAPLGWRITSVDRLGDLVSPEDSRDNDARLRLSKLWSEVESTGRPIGCELRGADHKTRVLIERVSPPKSFWVFGAGDDATPLSFMAQQLGWRVAVVDHRAGLVTPERFPGAHRLCAPWDGVADHFETPTDAAAVLMTHSLSADATLLPWLLQSGIGYVGVLGPKARIARVMQRAHAEGRLPSLDALDRLHSPLGLDIGASNPAEIAVAILAEVVADSHGRAAGPLRDREAPIHDPVRHEVIEIETQDGNQGASKSLAAIAGGRVARL